MRVNGKDHPLNAPQMLDSFLNEAGYNVKRVVVERNGAIITQDQFASVELTDSDHLEVVQFVGGG